MSNALDLQIRQQAAVSMLSQANMSREAVLKLYM
jgi:flagellin-like hook-associated protein FlgL